MDCDLVSVIIPCYNQGRFLGDAIDSVLAQTHRNTEIIVVSDGSTDDTASVARRYGSRVRLIESANAGSSAARNRGLDCAKGQWIQLLDADDVMLPGKLAACLAATRGLAGGVVVYTDYYRSGLDPSVPLPGGRVSPVMDCSRPWEEVASRWEAGLTIPSHAFLFSASVLREPPVRFDPDLPDHEDWDFLLRVLARRPTVVYVPEALVVYRRHPEAKCRVYESAQGLGFCRAIEKQITLHRTDRASTILLQRKLLEVQDRYGLTPWTVKLQRWFREGCRSTTMHARRVASALGAGRARRKLVTLRLRRR